MKSAFAALLALALSATAAEAAGVRWNPKAPENKQLLSGFDYAGVESVLASIGAKWQRSNADPARPTLLVTFPNGRKALLVMSACGADGSCKALSVQSFWTKIANSPPDRTTKAIETFNQKYAFAKAFVAADGRPALQRYLTADFGVIRGDLAVNLLVFSDQAERFAVDVLRPLETAKS